MVGNVGNTSLDTNGPCPPPIAFSGLYALISNVYAVLSTIHSCVAFVEVVGSQHEATPGTNRRVRVGEAPPPSTPSPCLFISDGEVVLNALRVSIAQYFMLESPNHHGWFVAAFSRAGRQSRGTFHVLGKRSASVEREECHHNSVSACCHPAIHAKCCGCPPVVPRLYGSIPTAIHSHISYSSIRYHHRRVSALGQAHGTLPPQ